MSASIEIDRVVKRFGDFTALSGVSLTIEGGAFFTLLGPSGCGKTTLLRLIAGFEFPTQGAIRLDGTDIAALPPNKRPVNTVFQSYALFPHLTVAQNIGFGLEMRDTPRAEMRAATEEMLRLVRLESLADRLPAQLSGGQQQRVALARALAPRPKVLLLDEPLSALDLKLRREMQGELRRLKAETGVTFLFVTHDQEEALSMSDRIAVMSDGEVRQVGSPREVYAAPADRFVAGFIGETSFLEGSAERQEGALLHVSLPGGRTLRARAPASAPTLGAPVTLAVRPEHVRFDAEGVLEGDVSEIVFTGAEAQAHVALPGGQSLVARIAGDGPQPAIGARVRLSVRDGAAQTLIA